MRRVLLLLGVLLILGVGAFGIVVWRAVSATSGPPIGPGRPAKALVLIDLQEDYTGPHARQPYAESAQLIASANQLMAAAQAGGWPIFIVRVVVPDDWFHRLLTGGLVVAGSPGAELDVRLAPPPGFVEITKTGGDSFSAPDLTAKLDGRQVGTLYVGGIDADHCVKATVGGARNRGYAVNVVREAIAVHGGQGLDKIVKGYEAKGAVMQTLAQATAELSAAPAQVQ